MKEIEHRMILKAESKWLVKNNYMPIIKKPLIDKCFNCESEVIVKFVPAHKNYSKKNNWGYWTEAEEYQNTHICDFCLYKLYKDHKWELRRLILNKKKRNILRSYIVDGKISVKKKPPFILKNDE